MAEKESTTGATVVSLITANGIPWVKYPPPLGDNIKEWCSLEEWRKLIVTGREVFGHILPNLCFGPDELRDGTGDPINALSLISLCNEAGVYPPPWVMKWLADAFKLYMESGGKANLEHLLSLGSAGRGKRKEVGKTLEALAAENRAYAVDRLVKTFNITIFCAAGMVAAQEIADPQGSVTGQSHPEHSRLAAWIAEDYSRRWRKRLEDVDVGVELLTEADKRELLKTFPAWSIPSQLG